MATSTLCSSDDASAFSAFAAASRRDAPSDTSLVAALKAEPVVLTRGEPIGISACAKIVTRTIHKDVRNE